jgi:RsiW-degrading membrane proteinase PrsW (M82 family)
MNRTYVPAIAAAALGASAVTWALLGSGEGEGLALIVAAGAAPIAAVLAIRARLDLPFPSRAMMGGAVVGPLVALASHAFVAAFAAAFFLGFAETGRHLLDALRADPRLTTILSSPWVILAIVELIAVAPLTEEAGKAIGARLARPRTRTEAFMAGAAAGAGFALVENLVYAAAAAALGGPWPAVVLGRALGAAVHPLATGAVAMGWWEWRQERSLARAAKRFLAGVGIHALWNGSLVALWVVSTAFVVNGSSPELGVIALGYEAAIGLAMAGLLWVTTASVASDRDPFAAVDFREGRTVAAWVLLGASVLVPVGILILAFPSFYLG